MTFPKHAWWSESTRRNGMVLFLVCFTSTYSSDHHVARGQHFTFTPETTLLEVTTKVGEALELPSNPTALLFEHHTDKHAPVLAPPYDAPMGSRRQLTLDEFDDIGGEVSIQCEQEGTRVILDLNGLIPDGVYTVWADFYDPPGMTPDFAYEVGLGALGPNADLDPNDTITEWSNGFTASPDGTSTLEVVHPGGAQSWFGEGPACALEASDFVLWGAYHIDGTNWGPVVAPDDKFDTFVAHFIAVASDRRAGDFNDDGVMDVADIDWLSEVVRTQEYINPMFDLNGDDNVDTGDRQVWVQDVAGTFFGDGDLNMTVEFADFLQLSGNFGQLGGWAQGDFDGNGLVEFGDFLAISANFGQSKVAAIAVPEPTVFGCVSVGLLAILIGRHRRSVRNRWPLHGNPVKVCFSSTFSGGQGSRRAE